MKNIWKGERLDRSSIQLGAFKKYVRSKGGGQNLEISSERTFSSLFFFYIYPPIQRTFALVTSLKKSYTTFKNE